MFKKMINPAGPNIFLPEAFVYMLSGKAYENPISEKTLYRPSSDDKGGVVGTRTALMTSDRQALWMRRLNNTQRVIMDHKMLNDELIEQSEKDIFAPPFFNTFCTTNNAEFASYNTGLEEIHIGAAHVYEENGLYDFLFLIFADGRLGLQEAVGVTLDSKEMGGCERFPKLFFTAMNNCKKIGIEKYPTVIKVKKHGIDRIKMESVIYISPNQKDFKSPLSQVAVDWKTRWWVRGHWVTIRDNSLGKDRLGNRNIFGRTWRVEHEKGNPQGIQKKQVRVLRDNYLRADHGQI